MIKALAGKKENPMCHAVHSLMSMFSSQCVHFISLPVMDVKGSLPLHDANAWWVNEMSFKAEFLQLYKLENLLDTIRK